MMVPLHLVQAVFSRGAIDPGMNTLAPQLGQDTIFKALVGVDIGRRETVMTSGMVTSICCVGLYPSSSPDRIAAS